MKRLLCNKITFALAAVVIFLVGMLRDPDLAKGDDLDGGPVAHDYMPGYQFDPDASQTQPLTKTELATLNGAADGGYATF